MRTWSFTLRDGKPQNDLGRGLTWIIFKIIALAVLLRLPLGVRGDARMELGTPVCHVVYSKKIIAQTRLVTLESLRSGRQSHEVFLIDRLWGREEA